MVKHNLEAILLIFLALLIGFLMSELAEANDGKKLYLSKCAACHNVNPTKQGSIGPELVGASLELITLKTQKREYPKNYVPKRKTRLMPKIPLKTEQIEFIHNYISGFKK